MNARLTEVDSKHGDISTIIFYEKRRLDPGYCENPERCEEENKEYSLCLFKNNYVTYFPPEIYYRYSTFLNMIKDRREIKLEQIKNKLQIKLFLESIWLFGADVTEIWHGNTFWQKYLKLIYPTSTTVRFDHGLSETLMYFPGKERTLASYIYSRLNLRKIINYVVGRYFVLPPIDVMSDVHFTLNSKHINAALGCEKTKMLSPDLVAQSAIFPTKGKAELSTGPGMAIVLLDNVKPWARSVSDHEAYFTDFETMLLSRGASKLKELGINTLVFKPKHWQEEHARDGINNFGRLSGVFELKYFPDYYDNLPLEYFLKLFNPGAVIGNLSSGLYYAKRLLPKVETYTYDDWFVDYTIAKFGATYPDFKRMRPILFGDQVKYFESLNPVTL